MDKEMKRYEWLIDKLEQYRSTRLPTATEKSKWYADKHEKIAHFWTPINFECPFCHLPTIHMSNFRTFRCANCLRPAWFCEECEQFHGLWQQRCNLPALNGEFRRSDSTFKRQINNRSTLEDTHVYDPCLRTVLPANEAADENYEKINNLQDPSFDPYPLRGKFSADFHEHLEDDLTELPWKALKEAYDATDRTNFKPPQAKFAKWMNDSQRVFNMKVNRHYDPRLEFAQKIFYQLQVRGLQKEIDETKQLIAQHPKDSYLQRNLAILEDQYELVRKKGEQININDIRVPFNTLEKNLRTFEIIRFNEGKVIEKIDPRTGEKRYFKYQRQGNFRTIDTLLDWAIEIGKRLSAKEA